MFEQRDNRRRRGLLDAFSALASGRGAGGVAGLRPATGVRAMAVPVPPALCAVLVGLLASGCYPDTPALAASSVGGLELREVQTESWRDGVLAWRGQAERLAGETGVDAIRLTRPSLQELANGVVLKGREGTLDVGAGRLELVGAVSATAAQGARTTLADANSAQPAPIDISADRFQGEGRDGIGLFEGNVVVKRGALTLTCDRLRVEYSRDRRKVERLLAQGHVVLESGRQRCTAERVTFEPDASRVVLEGTPVLTDDRSEMRGDRITWEPETGRVACDRCRVRWRGGLEYR